MEPPANQQFGERLLLFSTLGALAGALIGLALVELLQIRDFVTAEIVSAIGGGVLGVTCALVLAQKRFAAMAILRKFWLVVFAALLIASLSLGLQPGAANEAHYFTRGVLVIVLFLVSPKRHDWYAIIFGLLTLNALGFYVLTGARSALIEALLGGSAVLATWYIAKHTVSPS